MSDVRQKQISHAIIEGGFQIVEFEFIATGQSEFSLSFKADPEFNFNSSVVTARFICEYSPASDGRLNTTVFPGTWTKVVDAVKSWLVYLRQNLDAGNPWKELINIQEEKLDIDDNDESLFTEDQLYFIDKKIDIIFEAIKDFAINFEEIKNDLEYLKFEARKTSKKSWGLMVKGNFFGWFLNNYVPRESTSQIWHTIVQTLRDQNVIN
jgi:hypothetical protein